MRQHNCHARSGQNRQRMISKATASPGRTIPGSRPNGNRKPASHTWKVTRLPRLGVSAVRAVYVYPYGVEYKYTEYL